MSSFSWRHRALTGSTAGTYRSMGWNNPTRPRIGGHFSVYAHARRKALPALSSDINNGACEMPLLSPEEGAMPEPIDRRRAALIAYDVCRRALAPSDPARRAAMRPVLDAWVQMIAAARAGRACR